MVMRAVALVSEAEVTTGKRRVVMLDRQAPAPAPVEGQQHRAKFLRVHAASVGPLSSDATADLSPERIRSLRRRSGRELDARTIDEACRAANVSHAEAGAAWDRSREQAREVRAGERPVETHLGIENAPNDEACLMFMVLLAARVQQCRPEVFQAFVALLMRDGK
jgi:hypothetical protein